MRTAAILAACLAVAGLSFLLEPFALLPDPWAWIVWGDELGRLALDTTSGPSWKPLPPLVVAALSLTGDAAPVLWELIARAGALLAFVMAWRVARRLAGAWAGAVAVAACVVTLLPSWMNIVAMGREEGLLCAFILWAVDRHLARHEGQAFALGFGAALLRPEVWPFLGLYALWLLLRRPRLRVLVAVLGLLLAPLWFLPDIITAGDPLQSSQKAQGGISGTTLVEPVERALELIPAPIALTALAAAAIAVMRLAREGWRPPSPRALLARRPAGVPPPHEAELTVVSLLLGALAWVALVAVTSKVANYAGIQRFQHPAGAVAAVLAGVGAAWTAELLHEKKGTGTFLSRRPRLAPVVVGLVLLAALAPFLPGRARRIDRVVGEEKARSELDRRLDDAVEAAGGRERVVACGRTWTMPGNEPALAFRLERHIHQVFSDDPKPRPPGSVFRVDAQALRQSRVRRLGIRLYPVRDREFDPVAAADPWEVLAACRAGVRLGRARGAP